MIKYFLLLINSLYVFLLIFVYLLGLNIQLIAEEIIEKPKKIPIKFSTTINQALSKAKEENKNIVLIFESASCGYCLELKKEIQKIDSYKALNKNIFVLINVDRNYQTAKNYNVMGTPHVFILNSKGELMRERVGKQTADQFSLFLEITQNGENKKNQNEFGHLPWSLKGYRSDSICYSNVGYGPLKLSTLSPFQSLRVTYQPQTPSTLLKGQWEFHFQNVWANIWAKAEDDYFLDFETLSNQFNVGYGLSDTVQLEIQYDQRSRFGGIMDGFIQGFHDAFGLGQDGRKDVGKDNFDIEIIDLNGSDDIRLAKSDRGIYTQNLHLIYKHNVTCGSFYIPAFSYAVAVRRNLWSKDDFEENFPFDLSLSASVSRRLGEFYTYASIGYTYYGQGFLKNNQGLKLKNSQFSFLLAEEWKFHSRISLVLQYLFTEGAVKNRSPFSKASNEITFGLNWEFSNQKLLQIGMIENILEFDNSADFGIFASITVRM